MNLLFVDACPRGSEISRTHKLCRAFLDELKRASPRATVTTVALREKALAPLTEDDITLRERLLDAKAYNHPMLALAREFAEADAVLIGAPHWDLSFPAALKIYIERIFARDICFRYENNLPVGLCKARRAAYLCTAGGPVPSDVWGAGYVQAAMNMLGVTRFDAIHAENLDVYGADVPAILSEAEDRVRALARSFHETIREGNA